MNNVKKNCIIAVLVVFGLILIALSFYLIKIEYINYAIVLIAGIIIYFIFVINSLFESNSPQKKYENKIKEYLKTYDSILAISNKVPKLDDRNIIILNRMDDIINIQSEIRKPILYLKQIESCSFIVLDVKEAYVYIEKLNDDVISPVEIEIKNSERTINDQNTIDEHVLEELEKTTIIKLPNRKYYKVSPIREKTSSVIIKDKEASFDDLVKKTNTEVASNNNINNNNQVELPKLKNNDIVEIL